jgi:hypothetical protein
MQSRFDEDLERHGQSAQARVIVECEKDEINLYERYCDYYSYGVYVAEKLVTETSDKNG